MKNANPQGIRKNALSHGVHAQDVVLPWENLRDFVELHKALQDELEPNGLAEEATVCDIAGLYWKKRRLTVGSQLAYRRHPDAANLLKAAETGWQGVGDYLEASSRKIDDVNDALRSMVKSHAGVLQSAFVRAAELTKAELSSGVGKGEKPDGWVLGKAEQAQRQLDALNELTSTLNGIGTNVIVPILRLMEAQDLQESIAERAFRPDVIEREVKLGALIDRQIEKGLVRLVHLKEYKRLYRKKQIIDSSTK